MSTKLKEALDHVALAEKALKTGMFKWSPDYDTAASEYTKAATSFKLAGSSAQCKDSYMKAADMQEKLGSLFHSAKLLTQAANIASDLQQLGEAIDLMEKACILYREHGSPDTAASTLSKAAKMCESGLPERSVDMYLKAADLCEDDDKLRDASSYLNRAACIEIKQKRYIKSAEIMKRRIELIKNIGTLNLGYHVILGLIITYLAEDDYVAADNAYKMGFELSGFGESDEATYCEHFLKAFEDGDAQLLKKTQCQPTVTHLDTEFARLAKSLKITEQDESESPAASSKNTADSASSEKFLPTDTTCQSNQPTAAQDDDDDEEEPDDMC